MKATHRWLRAGSAVLLFAVATPVLAQDGAGLPVAAANPNTQPAGNMVDGVLHIELEIRNARWYPDDDAGGSLIVPVFATAGQAPVVPGPLVRAAAGTPVRISVTNTLRRTARVFGLHAHPSTGDDVLEIQPGETARREFVTGAPGLYHYYAVTDPQVKTLADRWNDDGALSGAFVIDPPGPVEPDRIWVLGIVNIEPNPMLESGLEVLTINGKAWPYTERIVLREGEPVRWRVVNSTPSDHPMHLHGAYFRVIGTGDVNRYRRYSLEEERTVVTEFMLPGTTFDMEWTPPAPGGWLFHCHYMLHMMPDSVVPRLEWEIGAHGQHAPAAAPGKKLERHGMGGLVLGITVQPKPGTAVAEAETYRRIGFTVSAEPQNDRHGSTIHTTLFDPASGASSSGSPGPLLVLTRGEPVQIDVQNRMAEATAIHWHGLELESYYDGVPGVGFSSRSVTPVIAPGESFPVRITPPRAGTFIYHTHWGHDTQLTGGLYGPIVIVEPGTRFDPDAERILLVGAAEMDWETAEILLNGERAPAAIEMQAGRTYRLRLINIAPNHDVTVSLGGESDAMQWRLVAKDGFELPPHQRRTGPARLLFSVGETYDYEFTPTRVGEFPLTVQSLFQEKGVVHGTLRVR